MIESMSDSSDFRYTSEIAIDAPRETVFDYLTNPHSWLEWYSATKSVTGPNRPVTLGENFDEGYEAPSSGPQVNHWTVVSCRRPEFWAIEAESQNGEFCVTYSFEALDNTTKFTRSIANTGRAAPMSPDTVAKVEAQAAAAMTRIKACVEALGAKEAGSPA
jgi:uncharacterized protein YndB with AHSA1/START domain